MHNLSVAARITAARIRLIKVNGGQTRSLADTLDAEARRRLLDWALAARSGARTLTVVLYARWRWSVQPKIQYVSARIVRRDGDNLG